LIPIKDSKNKQYDEVYSINYSNLDALARIYAGFLKVFMKVFKCCCKNKEPKDFLTLSQGMYLEGYEKVERDVNILDIVSTINKI
jgi:hypothetical protein